MTIADQLRTARARIERPEAWCRGSFAVLEDGKAVAWCTVGALRDAEWFVQSESDRSSTAYLQRSLPSGCGIEVLSVFNDDPSTTHADVLALYDRAIALAEAEGV